MPSRERVEAFVARVEQDASSLVIQYRGPRGPSAELFWFDAENKLCRAAAHYAG